MITETTLQVISIILQVAILAAVLKMWFKTKPEPEEEIEESDPSSDLLEWQTPETIEEKAFKEALKNTRK